MTLEEFKAKIGGNIDIAVALMPVVAAFIEVHLGDGDELGAMAREAAAYLKLAGIDYRDIVPTKLPEPFARIVAQYEIAKHPDETDAEFLQRVKKKGPPTGWSDEAFGARDDSSSNHSKESK